MPRYRFDVAYDGRGFQGFQSQSHQDTIQDHLERTLRVLLKESPRVIGASRTDSGVSAYQQVASFEVSEELQVEKFLRSWNALLPKTIRVYKLTSCATDFHPIASSLGKIYRYRLWLGACRDPFLYPWVLEVSQDLDIERLQKELTSTLGVHNFKALSKTGSSVTDYKRHIIDLQIFFQDRLIEVWVHGDGFLRHMIRALIGTALTLSQKKTPARLTSLREILATEDRSKAYRTAPAPPLTLIRCLYPGEETTITEEKKNDHNSRSYSLISS